MKTRKGFSNVVSTIILTSVLLSIMVATSFVSRDLLNAQIAESEFETAKNLILAVDDEIESLLFKPGSSSVIKTSFTSVLPGYEKTGEYTILEIAESEPYNLRVNTSVEVNSFQFTGSRIIGGNYNYDLRGSSTLFTSMHNGSFGRIHIGEPKKLQLSLDYNRILYTMSGKVYLINNQTGVFGLHNTLELVCIKLEFGEFASANYPLIIIQNIQAQTPITRDLEGNFTITVRTPDETEVIYFSDIGGDPSLPTVVNVHHIAIKIDVLEGG
jgi:hypothetical protein